MKGVLDYNGHKPDENYSARKRQKLLQVNASHGFHYPYVLSLDFLDFLLD